MQHPQPDNCERGFEVADDDGVGLKIMNNKYHWDPKEYARSSSEQQKWARELIQKLDLMIKPDIILIGSISSI